jgi:hypothetical protein
LKSWQNRRETLLQSKLPKDWETVLKFTTSRRECRFLFMDRLPYTGGCRSSLSICVGLLLHRTIVYISICSRLPSILSCENRHLRKIYVVNVNELILLTKKIVRVGSGLRLCLHAAEIGTREKVLNMQTRAVLNESWSRQGLSWIVELSCACETFVESHSVHLNSVSRWEVRRLRWVSKVRGTPVVDTANFDSTGSRALRFSVVLLIEFNGEWFGPWENEWGGVNSLKIQKVRTDSYI